MDTRCESRAEGDFFLYSRFSLSVVCFCFDSFADRQYDLFLFFVVISKIVSKEVPRSCQGLKES